MGTTRVMHGEAGHLPEALRLLASPEYLPRALDPSARLVKGTVLLGLEGFLCSVRDRYRLSIKEPHTGAVTARLQGKRSSISLSYMAGPRWIDVSSLYEGPYKWRISRTVRTMSVGAAFAALRDAEKMILERSQEPLLENPYRYRELLARCVLDSVYEMNINPRSLERALLGLAGEAAEPGDRVLLEGEWSGGSFSALVRGDIVAEAVVQDGAERRRGATALSQVSGPITLRVYIVDHKTRRSPV